MKPCALRALRVTRLRAFLEPLAWRAWLPVTWYVVGVQLAAHGFVLVAILLTLAADRVVRIGTQAEHDALKALDAIAAADVGSIIVMDHQDGHISRWERTE